MEIKTIHDIIEYGYHNYQSKTALMKKEDDRWMSITWSELKLTVDYIAKGLISMGLKPKDKVCILSNIRAEWTLIDIAIILAGGITVPIYQSNTASQCRYILKDAKAKFLFLENEKQCVKINEIKGSLSHLKQIIVITESKNDSYPTLKEVIESGQKESESKLESRISNAKPSDVVSIVYTSGTSGVPKGAVINHENIIAQVFASSEMIPEGDDLQTIQFLPLAHVFSRTVQYAYLYRGVTQWYAESLEKLPQNILESKPHLFVAVPRVFEKIHSKIIAKKNQGSFIKRAIFDWSIKIGQNVSQLSLAKVKIPYFLKMKYEVAHTLVFQKVKNALGGQLKFVILGGAPLRKDVSLFFHAMDIILLEGYGLTETTSATHANRPHHYKFGTVGQPLKGVEVILSKDKEILIRGKTIMSGYYKNKRLTREVIDKKGWFHTGDIGEIDEDNFLKIVDRKKDIIITSSGKNIAPQNIENHLKKSDYISNAMVYGDQKKYLTALIILDFEMAVQWAKEKGIEFKNHSELSKNPELIKLIENEVEELNKALASYQTIKKFNILDHDLSQENEEITPTLKIKRNKIIKQYQVSLDKLYEEVS